MAKTTTPMGPPGPLLRLDPKTGALRQRTYRLAVIKGPDKGKSVPLADCVRVGTHEQADLVLTDSTVSRYHLELRPRADGTAIRDLGSTNGTFLIGARVTEAVVDADAHIRIGNSTLQLVCEDELDGEQGAGSLPGIVGQSAPMRALSRILSRAAASDSTVLLRGETGTGKEGLARAIHALSRRRNGPFVTVDCGAIDPQLASSELFGHLKGAFTDAHAGRQGAFLNADGGTLFLDEIAEAPVELQPRLLRALDLGMISPLGADAPRSVDVRVVAASCARLDERVAQGRFRQDLYFRLAVIEVEVPPLRERREDIPLLVAHFLSELGRPADYLPRETVAELSDAPWRGNVRELRNAVQRLVSTEPAASKAEPAARLSPQAAEEQWRIRDALRKSGGNQKRAAELLGISRRTLLHRLDRYGFERPRKK